MNTPQPPINNTEQSGLPESALTMFLKLSTDLFCIRGQDGYFQQVNVAWEKVLGWTDSELRSHFWISLVHPDDLEVTQNAEVSCLQTEEFVSYENRYRHKDGSYRWFSWRVSLGKDGLFYVVGKEIDTAKQAENVLSHRRESNVRLDESEDLFHCISTCSPIGIFLADIEGRCTYANPSLLAITGLSFEQMLGEGWIERVYPSDREWVFTEWCECAQQGQECYQEYRFQTSDGTVRWVQARTSPMYSAQGSLLGHVGTIEDITERKQAEAELQQAHQQLTLHVDNSPLAIMEWDCEFRLKRWSKQAEKLFGWKAEEVLHLHPQDWRFVHEEDEETVESLLGSLQDGTLQYLVDGNRNYTKDGRVVYCEWYNSALRDESGNIVSILSLVQDLTEHKLAEVALQQVMAELEMRVEERTQKLQQANEQLQIEIAERQQTEAALRQSEALFRRVFDEAPIGMVLSGLNSCFFRANQAFLEMLGYTESELMTLSYADITYPQDWKQKHFHLEQLKNGEINSFQREERFLKKNQETLWGNLTAIALRNEVGEILYALGMLEDITERKQAEVALQQSEARYRAIVEDQTELICRFNSSGTLTFVNDAYCRYFDKPRTELIGHSFVPMVLQEDQELIAQLFNSLSPEQPIVTHEQRVILPLGELRWQQWTNRVVFDEAGKILEFQSVGRDITEIKRAEAEMRRALEKERELGELRSSFVALVSHEFRTPLTTIQSSAELLEHYSNRLTNEKKHNHYKRIQSAVSRMTQLLEEVLMIGKAEAGKLKFEPSELDLVAFCHDIVESMQMSGNHEHTITFVSNGECFKARIDEKLLEHIITNLLSNAIKYSPLHQDVNFELICIQDSATFCIQDSGIGIPTEDQKQLFESFGRASNVGNIPGTGLGLAIVKQCVDLHGGKITVESKVGVGTTFTVMLPLHAKG